MVLSNDLSEQDLDFILERAREGIRALHHPWHLRLDRIQAFIQVLTSLRHRLANSFLRRQGRDAVEFSARSKVRQDPARRRQRESKRPAAKARQGQSRN